MLRLVPFVLIMLASPPAFAQDAPVPPDSPAVGAAVSPESVEQPVQLLPEDDGLLEVKFNQIKAIKQRRPAIPAWSKLDLPIVCKLDFQVDAAGIPLAVDPVECPKEIQANAVKASMKWRFEPHVDGDEPVAVKFRMVLKINH
jgi:hypothetical protein